jgi:nucleotide-binding universal stress UspA family protein
VTSPIIAGTDGSEESLVAVEWAALEAARRRVPLAIVHALDQFPGAAAAHPPLWGHDLPHPFGHDLPHRARSALAGAMRYAAKAAPGIDLRAVAVCGRADQVLTAIAASAPLVVIGTRGSGGFPGLRLGSVALRLASRASCPVVFTGPAGRPASDEIVVGAGDGDQSLAALEFGFGEADLLGARLTAVHAWAHPQAGWPDNYDDWMLSVGPSDEGASPLLAEQVAPWLHKYPGVPVTQTAVHGQPWRVLVLASERADLVVIGGHRGEGSPVPGLGSVSYAMLRHACCPVALIPDCRAGSTPRLGSSDGDADDASALLDGIVSTTVLSAIRSLVPADAPSGDPGRGDAEELVTVPSSP